MEKYRLDATRSSDMLADVADAIKRGAPRTPVYMVAARLFADALPAPLSCTVRDVSGTGARLELDRDSLKRPAAAVSLPEFLTIYFCPDHTEVDCRLAWQDSRHFGVRFLGEVHPSERQAT